MQASKYSNKYDGLLFGLWYNELFHAVSFDHVEQMDYGFEQL